MVSDGEATRILGDFDRQLASMVRMGVVTEIEGTRARVAIGALETDLLPWTSTRAGQAYDWSQPQLGEQVIVLTLWGELSQGIIIGSVAQEAYTPPAKGTTWAKRFADGTTLRYDSDHHALEIVAEESTITLKCDRLTIIAKTGITLNTPRVECSGDIVAGGISLKSHKHSGVQPGGSMTGPAL